MLFITNRALNEGYVTEIGRKVTFDLNNNQAGQSLYFCERKAPDDYVEIGSKNFLKRLKHSEKKEILLFVHGYSNLPEPHIFPRTQQLSSLLEVLKLDIEVVPIIWPCDNDLGAIKDYFDDQNAADASGPAFSRALHKFLAWSEKHLKDEDPCLKRINVLAHSMGNRVLREALYDFAKSLSWNVPYFFRNMFLVAADVVNETLHRDEDGRFICQSARNVVVYYASDDLALRSSKAANLANAIASRRLGHTGPERLELTPDNVYAIDCDDVNTVYDKPKGHSYFLADPQGAPGEVFKHIAACLDTGRVPTDASGRRFQIKK